MARDYGIWRDDKGYTHRAIVIVDREGIVRHSEVIPQGAPDVEELLAKVKEIAQIGVAG